MNDSSEHINVDIDSNIQDAFNSSDDNSQISDAFNDSSTSFGSIDVDFDNVFNGAFGGDGDSNGFAFNQVADIVDNDSLSGVTQSNSGNFQLYANAAEATLDAAGSSAWDGVGGDVTAVADAHATVSGSAFNLDIVLGANLQQNAVDVTVVGGGMDNDITDSSEHH